MDTKIIGWVILLVGVVGLWYSYSSGYGVAGYIAAVIISGLGVWMAMKKEGGTTM